MKAKKLTQKEMLELVLEDLQSWVDRGGDESDCSMSFALRNGFDLHAANLWLGTGAASEDVCAQVRDLRISRKKEMEEINTLCAMAHIYVCPDCNHHAFLDDDEGDSISCMSCLKTAYKNLKPSEAIDRIKEMGIDSETVTELSYAKFPALYFHAADDSKGFRIVAVNKYGFASRQGIHVDGSADNFERRIQDAIETAQKDNFATIWIHAS